MAIAELSCFAIKGKSYAATEGAHDDIVMSLVLFAWVVNQRYFKDLMDQDLRLQMYQERMREIEEDLTPFGFIEDGQNDEDNYTVEGNGDVWQISQY